MAVVRLAAAQLGPAHADKARNLGRVLALLGRASAAGADLVAFPELALTPYFCHGAADGNRWADSEGSPHLAAIARAARDSGINVVIPFAERGERECYNAARLIDATGALAGLHRKVHIPRQERKHFVPGVEFGVRPLGKASVGVLICADRTYPESWRVLGVKGAEVVCAPYNTSTLLAHPAAARSASVAWIRDLQATRMRAAASMNGYFVVASGKAGRENGVDYIGDSMIISPWGDIVARSVTTAEELVVADADLDEVAAFRARGHYDRRQPAAYRELAVDL